VDSQAALPDQNNQSKQAEGKSPLACAFTSVNQTIRRMVASSNLKIFCSFIVEDGAGGATIKEQTDVLSKPHDIIKFSGSHASSNFDEFRRLYEKGLSLRDISAGTGFPKTTIRSVLVANNIPLKASSKAKPDAAERPQRAFYGAIPYGYSVLDGKLLVDPREIKIVRKILAQRQKGMSFNAIAKWLNSQKVPSKFNKSWSDKTVASIIRKHPTLTTEGE